MPRRTWDDLPTTDFVTKWDRLQDQETFPTEKHMNATTVKNTIASLNIPTTDFSVKGEATGNLRFYTIRLKQQHIGRAQEVRTAVLNLINQRKFTGGVDVYLEGDITNKKYA